MATRREAALPGPKILRNAELPETVPAEGLIILRDGIVGEPEDVTLSPVSFAWRHRAELEIFVRGNDPASRATSLDDLAQEGAQSFKATILPVILHYQ